MAKWNRDRDGLGGHRGNQRGHDKSTGYGQKIARPGGMGRDGYTGFSSQGDGGMGRPKSAGAAGFGKGGDHEWYGSGGIGLSKTRIGGQGEGQIFPTRGYHGETK